MLRTLTAVLLGAGVAAAAPVPKAPPPPAPKAGTTLQLSTAKMSGENIQITQMYDQVTYVSVQETIEQNGQQVVVTRAVPQVRQVAQTYQMALKGVKASTADGKEISEEDLAKKLADTTAVVQVPANFDPEWKKLFTDDVIFLQPGNAGVVRPGVIRGGPAILPAVPPGGGPVLQPLPVPVPIGK
jgi:hypothetical protein